MIDIRGCHLLLMLFVSASVLDKPVANAHQPTNPLYTIYYNRTTTTQPPSITIFPNSTTTHSPFTTTPAYPTSSTAPTPPFEGKIWALLVAGSNGFYNYRHQADLCHAYQILHANGIPDENIVVMMFDDIANNADNPRPGELINRPGGPDVYRGVPKDYTGIHVNAKTFLSVLKGDKAAVGNNGTGRVIESGPNDHVFVNFVDHGGPGALMFPEDELLADELIETLNQMAEDKKFGKLVLYVEACYSGSMFDSFLADNLNIFVTTAADPHESSYACYFDETIGTYLGDVFSVNWMEDSEKEYLPGESLNHQFEKVRTKTENSHVEEYGDLDIGSTKLSSIIGSNSSRKQSDQSSFHLTAKLNEDSVASVDVPVSVLLKKLEKVKGKYHRQELKMKLHHINKKREIIDHLFNNIITNIAAGDETRKDILTQGRYPLDRSFFNCYRTLFTEFSKKCLTIAKNPYVNSKLYIFVNFCYLPWSRVPTMLNAIDTECSALKYNLHDIGNVI